MITRKKYEQNKLFAFGALLSEKRTNLDSIAGTSSSVVARLRRQRKSTIGKD